MLMVVGSVGDLNASITVPSTRIGEPHFLQRNLMTLSRTRSSLTPNFAWQDGQTTFMENSLDEASRQPDWPSPTVLYIAFLSVVPAGSSGA